MGRVVRVELIEEVFPLLLSVSAVVEGWHSASRQVLQLPDVEGLETSLVEDLSVLVAGLVPERVELSVVGLDALRGHFPGLLRL